MNNYFIFMVLLSLASWYQFGYIYMLFLWGLHLLYVCELYNTINEIIRYKYSQYKSMKSLIVFGGRHKNIIYGTLRLIVKTAWHRLLSYINNTVTSIGKNKNSITVSHKGKLYSVLLGNMNIPDNITEIIDQDDNDVTDEIIPYLRFKALELKLTPKNLGYKQLEIIYSNSKPIDVEGDEEIKI